MNNRVYNAIKYASMVVLPAFATLYFALGSIWGLSNVQQVLGTIAALNVFLGALAVGLSKAYYKAEGNFDGTINVTEEEGVTVYTLELDSNPDTLGSKPVISFRVNRD